MPDAASPRGYARWSRRIRVVCLVVVLVGPVVASAIEVRGAAAFGGAVAPDAQAQYLASRHPLVDEMLPQGDAGVRVVEDLGGPWGIANMQTGAIALARDVVTDAWPGSTELHERAHLVEAFLPEQVAALMARMPPATGSGTATDSPTQHFAEMASNAWELLIEPEGLCVDGTPEERLRHMEAYVPGTSGFLLWYLRHPQLAGTERATQLRPIAAAMAEPFMREWTTLWEALEAQRTADGTFRRWPAPTMLSVIERHQSQIRASGRWWDVASSYLFEPSRLLLRAAG